MISTRLTSFLDIKTPIVGAPMAYVSPPGFVSAVSAAGSFGFLGAGNSSPEQLVEALHTIRANLGLQPDVSLPVGVGFITWILEKNDVSADPRLTSVLEERVQAVWFAFGKDIGKYVRQVREHDSKRDHKTKVFVLVNSVEEASQAANEWRVDALVVQGNEAGGHGSAKAPPVALLLTAVLGSAPQNGPVILAAGGIATGAQIASMLTLGADGVVVGTRFLLTHESGYPPVKKEELVKAGLGSTARSTAFDEINRTVGWPTGIDGRGIANEIVSDVSEGLSLEERLRRADEGKDKGSTSRLPVWAGAGVGLTNEIQSVEKVVCELQEETVHALQRASQLLVH
ncbi:2-nitropropane dioxygenase [Guyanagaster necrorhizus]|uniref:2-nitropropane dioxygenase n=1 Tax=Guyanagaster necrorhizus TaxID=856835 RepID=A0A9P8ANS8_9AGAR|nr:2-nitropropane dioxygenase [Guyanagaster necrorhizus MCA 3950]KAG7442056.1 2-nitropropane dioxygenase [Guyanagaster necrorhizus MCA 3950]